MQNNKTGFENFIDSRQIEGTWRTEQILNDTSYYIQDKEILQDIKDFFYLLEKLKVEGKFFMPFPLWFELENNKITVFGGFKTDYASIPRLLWRIITPWEIKRPAILHDAGYRILWFLKNHEFITERQFTIFRKAFDELFREALDYVDPPISDFKKIGTYKSVRWFGWMKGAGLRDKHIIENNFPQIDRIIS